MKTHRGLQVLALVIATGGMAAGALFAFLAWQQASLPLAASAVSLLLTAPALAVVAMLGRRPCQDLSDDLGHAEATLRLIRTVRGHVCAAASFAVVLWFCEAFGMIRATTFVVVYTFMCAVALAAYLPWLARAEKRIGERREVFRIQLSELKAASFST
jgi:hypothetical protein